jgi:hypothetical protein
MASTANTAGLTSGPSGSVSLKGQVSPGGPESITSKMTGAGHQLTTPGGPTAIKIGAPRSVDTFTSPGGVTKVVSK